MRLFTPTVRNGRRPAEREPSSKGQFVIRGRTMCRALAWEPLKAWESPNSPSCGELRGLSEYPQCNPRVRAIALENYFERVPRRIWNEERPYWKLAKPTRCLPLTAFCPLLTAFSRGASRTVLPFHSGRRGGPWGRRRRSVRRRDTGRGRHRACRSSHRAVPYRYATR